MNSEHRDSLLAAEGRTPSHLKLRRGRVTTSPLLMTWANFAARTIAAVGVLVAVLTRLPAADVSLYYLFAAVTFVPAAVAVGFAPTFARVVAFVSVPPDERRPPERLSNHAFATARLPDLAATNLRILGAVAGISVPILAIGGSLMLRHAIDVSSSPSQSWAAWAVVVATCPIVLLGGAFASVLDGLNQIHVEQRVAAAFSLAAGASSVAVVLLDGGLLGLIVVGQAWAVLGVVRLRWLARVAISRSSGSPAGRPSSQIAAAVWPASWRSVVGVSSQAAATALMSTILSRQVSSEALASLLLGVRLISQISELCRAPFYSKVPALNQARVRGNHDQMIRLARRGMATSLWVFVVAVVVTAAIGPSLVRALDGSVAFPNAETWWLLGLAMFAERVGAMHVQLYSTTNHIIWHWLNGVSSIMTIVAGTAAMSEFGVNAFPGSQLAAWLVFYVPIAMWYSHREMGSGVFRFERHVSLPPALIMLASGVGVLVVG